MRIATSWIVLCSISLATWHICGQTNAQLSSDAKTKPKLRGVTTLFEPFAYRTKDGVLSGFVTLFMDAISAKLGFDYQLRALSEDGKDPNSGEVIPGETGEALIRDVRTKLADFAISDLEIPWSLEPQPAAVDFTTSFYNDSLVALIPRKDAANMSTFFDLVKHNRAVIKKNLGSAREIILPGTLSISSRIFQSLRNSRNSAAHDLAQWMMRNQSALATDYHQMGVYASNWDRVAMLMESSWADYFAATRCWANLTTLRGAGGDIYPIKSYVVALQANSTWTAKFNDAIREMNQDGTTTKLLTRSWAERASYCKSKEDDYPRV